MCIFIYGIYFKLILSSFLGYFRSLDHSFYTFLRPKALMMKYWILLSQQGFICSHDVLSPWHLIYGSLWPDSLEKDLINHTEHFPKRHKVGGLWGHPHIVPLVHVTVWGCVPFIRFLTKTCKPLWRKLDATFFPMPLVTKMLLHFHTVMILGLIFYNSAHIAHQYELIWPSQRARGFLVTLITSCSQS